MGWAPAEPAGHRDGDPGPWNVTGDGDQLERAFRDAGLVTGGLAEEPSVVIHVAGSGNPAQLCGELLQTVQGISGATRPPRFVVVTRNGTPVPDAASLDPGHAALWGFCASLKREQPELRTLLIDVDDALDPHQVASVITAETTEDQVVLRDGRSWAPRLQSQDHGRDEQERLRAPDGSFELRARSYGSLGNLDAIPMEPRSPGTGEVLVEVRAAALNFKDVLFVLGMLEEWSREAGISSALDQPLGFECAGVVSAVGEGVSGVHTGDRVVVAAAGCLASHVTVASNQVHVIPDDLSFEDAASVPTVFTTALYALEHMADIASGERVLIHAGAGGVGQAAIQVAQRKGCQVWATASDWKHPHLEDQGVHRVMDSRSVLFADQIDEDTGGEGVHVVLNSLTGDAIPRSLDATAEGGRFVDIGKIGAWTADQVHERRPDLRYANFDLAEIVERDPVLHRQLLEDVFSRLEAGELTPTPTTIFELAEARRALGFLAAARNVGKVVLRMSRAPDVRDDRTYLITGGLGVLGLHAARKLVEEGARHVALVGRRQPGEDAVEVMDDLRAHGARVHVASADLADAAQVTAFVSTLTEDAPPLGGVYHAAGVLSDGMAMNQTAAAFEAVMAPKVDGLLALEAALREAENLPEWWVCTSSVAAVLGSAGQTPYSAANAWMDAWCHRQRSRGVRATSINWGPWSGGGMAASLATRDQVRFAEIGLRTIDPELGTGALMRALSEDVPQVMVLPIRWRRWMKQYRGQVPPLLSAFARHAVRAPSGPSPIVGELERANPEDRHGLLLQFLSRELSRVMGLASADRIEPDRPFTDLGVDSLLAVDMRNRLESAFASPLPVTLLFDHPDLDALASYLVAQLADGVADGTSETAPLSEVDALLAEIESLSDEEVERLLSEDDVDR